jgi:hypothetical protein
MRRTIGRARSSGQVFQGLNKSGIPLRRCTARRSAYVQERDGFFYYVKGVYLDNLRRVLASNSWTRP